MCLYICAGKKKSIKEKRELRKAKKKDPEVVTAAAARKPTPEELAAAGARLGPRAQVCCSFHLLQKQQRGQKKLKGPVIIMLLIGMLSRDVTLPKTADGL